MNTKIVGILINSYLCFSNFVSFSLFADLYTMDEGGFKYINLSIDFLAISSFFFSNVSDRN